MKNVVFLIGLACLVTTKTWAGDVEAGVAAKQQGDFAEAAAAFQSLADQGNADAQVDLGLLYYDGKGVPQDFAKAAALFRKAAEQGNARGQTKLGFLYAMGKGVGHDYVATYALFKLSGAHVSDSIRNLLMSRLSAADIQAGDALVEDMQSSGVGAGLAKRELIVSQLPAPPMLDLTRPGQPAYRIPWPTAPDGTLLTGSTTLLILVSAEGRPLDIRVEKSSGYRELDRATIEAAKRWRFEPSRKGGVPVDGYFRLPFTMDFSHPHPPQSQGPVGR